MDWNRFKNPGTILALVGMLGLLANQFGLDIDLEWLDTTADLVCGILILVGVMNNPTTKGIDNPLKKY